MSGAAALLRAHVDRFNEGVRTGNWAPMLEAFAEDAEMTFEGVPAGPFRGRQAIGAAYSAQPPDDEAVLLAEPEEREGEAVAPYAWSRDGVRAGEMCLSARDRTIVRLVVTFGS